MDYPNNFAQNLEKVLVLTLFCPSIYNKVKMMLGVVLGDALPLTLGVVLGV